MPRFMLDADTCAYIMEALAATGVETAPAKPFELTALLDALAQALADVQEIRDGNDA